jgi:subtilase-type serine protease
MKAVYSRLSENFLMPLSEDRGGAWIKAVGSFANYSGDNTRIGYREDTYGVALGYDDKIGPDGIWGIYTGYNTIDIKTINGSANNGNLPHAGVYAGKRWGKTFYAVADLMAGILSADTQRFEQIGHNTGTYKANMFGATLEAGFVMSSWETGVIRPSFSLHGMRADYRNQNESGASPFYVDNFKAHRFEAFPSVQIAQQFMTPWNRPACLDLSFGWRAALTNNQTKLTASFSRVSGDRFEIDCDKYSRDGVVIGFGLRMMPGGNTMLGVNYDHEVSRDVARHTLNATLRWAW